MWGFNKKYKDEIQSLQEENKKLSDIINNLEQDNKQIEHLKEKNLRLSKDIDTLFEYMTDDVLNNHDLSLKNARLSLMNVLISYKNKRENEELNDFISSQLDDIDSFGEELLAEYESEITDKYYEYCEKIRDCETLLTKLEHDKNSLKKDIIDLEEEKLYQDFGLYTPIYNLMSSSLYKEKLDECRKDQKLMIKQKTAAQCYSQWTVKDSRQEGIKMTNRNIKLALRGFNNECDYLINKVKYHNVDSIEQRIIKSFNDLNKLTAPLDISISEDYLNLKLDELHLCFEYEDKKQQEREELKERKRDEREQAALLKEIEEERKKLQKEMKHYQTHLKHIHEQIEIESDCRRLEFLQEKELETQKILEDIDNALRDIDYREANQKAGYVYVISNIGSFGEDVYKIGMTRRLDPQDRIDELSTAAVPFKFDVHAMIFSDDAPALEAAIHRELEDKKINLVNNRKEFFKVSLAEIEQIIEKNFDKTVDFREIPDAQQYRESLKIKEIMASNTQ